MVGRLLYKGHDTIYLTRKQGQTCPAGVRVRQKKRMAPSFLHTYRTELWFTGFNAKIVLFLHFVTYILGAF